MGTSVGLNVLFYIKIVKWLSQN